MANPYKEAEKNKKKSPARPQEPAQEMSKAKDTVMASTELERAAEASVDSTVIISLDDIGMDGKDTKSSYSLYLTDSVMREAEKRSKKAKMRGVSPYIDEVLKRAFGLK